MTFALIGSESLLGREIRDLAATSSPALELRLIAALGEQPGKLTLVGDEPALVGGLTPKASPARVPSFSLDPRNRAARRSSSWTSNPALPSST